MSAVVQKEGLGKPYNHLLMRSRREHGGQIASVVAGGAILMLTVVPITVSWESTVNITIINC